MGGTTDMAASPMLRGAFGVAAAIMLGLWGWSLLPPIQNWGNPNEDGFSYVPVFYTTLVCLPAGLLLLAGARAGQGRSVARARKALIIAGGLTLLVAAFLVVQRIANNNDGKVFGIQIGLGVDRAPDVTGARLKVQATAFGLAYVQCGCKAPSSRILMETARSTTAKVSGRS